MLEVCARVFAEVMYLTAFWTCVIIGSRIDSHEFSPRASVIISASLYRIVNLICAARNLLIHWRRMWTGAHCTCACEWLGADGRVE